MDCLQQGLGGVACSWLLPHCGSCPATPTRAVHPPASTTTTLFLPAIPPGFRF